MFNPLNLILQQWQGIFRFLLTSLGSYLVTKGLITADNWATLTPYLMTAAGSIIAAASAGWTIHSNQAQVIKDTASKLRAQGK